MAITEILGVTPNSILLTVKSNCEGRVKFLITATHFTETSNTHTHLLVNDFYRVQYVEIQTLIFNSPQLDLYSYNHIEYNVRDIINVIRKTQIILLIFDT